LEETVDKIDKIDSFKTQIYEKSERHEHITTNELDQLILNAIARSILEAEKLQLRTGKSIPLTDSASFFLKIDMILFVLFRT
jgi:hypothetical protein